MTRATPAEIRDLTTLLERKRDELDRLLRKRRYLERELAVLDRYIRQQSARAAIRAKGNGRGGSGLRRRGEPESRELMKAVESGNLSLTRACLKAGANPNARSEHGEPLLMLAASRGGSLPIVRELLRAGAQVDATDPSGNTALIACARDEDLPVVVELVENGANINARNLAGDTPLTNAACWGSSRVARLLLRQGADPRLTDGMDLLPVQLAQQQGHRSIVDLLRRRSVRPDPREVTARPGRGGRRGGSWRRR